MAKIITILCLLAVTSFTYAQTTQATSLNFDCTMSDGVIGDNAAAEKKTFNKQTPMIYCVCHTKDVKKGDVIKATWIAVDSHNVAPPNYKIDESNLTVSEDLSGGLTYTAKFSFSKPTRGWPIGRYKVDISVNNNPVTSKEFNVK